MEGETEILVVGDNAIVDRDRSADPFDCAIRSAAVSTEPPEVTAFCRATLSKICCGVTPSVASLA